MAYFIYEKNNPNNFYLPIKIAETQSDLNNIKSININEFKIIEVSQSDFDNVRLRIKSPEYNGNSITYTDDIASFKKRSGLENYINMQKINFNIKENQKFYNYFNILNNLDIDTIPLPLNCSLEKYLNDIGHTTVLNPLQLP